MTRMPCVLVVWEEACVEKGYMWVDRVWRSTCGRLGKLERTRGNPRSHSGNPFRTTTRYVVWPWSPGDQEFVSVDDALHAFAQTEKETLL